MSNTNWRAILGWTDEQLDDIRLSGFTFLREGKYDKALLFFKTLLILNPHSVYDAQTLGALYLQMGEKQQALELLNRALAMEPAHEPTLLNKTKTLLLLNRKEEAFALAVLLEKSKDASIAGDASALLAAYK